MEIQYPITVNKINFREDKTYSSEGWRGEDIGKFVAVRPCGKEYGNKTYLGIYLGEFALSQGVFYDKEKGELTVSRFMYNPAIYVFDLKKVIFGCESWWGIIESEKDLQQISDKDIENIWYVKVLKQISEKEKSDG
jgi:hypothetical protein